MNVLKTILKPTFPKVALICVLSCGVLMFKFKSPAHRKNTNAVAVKVLKKEAAPIANQAVPAPLTKKAEENVAALAPIVAAKVATPRKLAVVKKSAKRFYIKKAVEPALPEVSDALFEPGLGDIAELVSPLDELAVVGFTEAGDLQNFDSNALLSSIQIDESLTPNVFPLEQRLLVKEGEIQENLFPELTEKLTTLKSEPLTVVAAPSKKIPVNTQAAVQEIKNGAQDILLAKAEPRTLKLEEAAGTTTTESNSITTSPEEPAVEKSDPNETTELEDDEPIVAHAPSLTPSKQGTSVSPELNSQTKSMMPSLQPMTAAVGPSITVTSQSKTAVVTTRERNIIGLPNTSETTKGKADKGAFGQRGPIEEPTEDSDPGTFKGRLFIDKGLQHWLDTNNGHVELYLHQEGSKDPQDTTYIDYEPGDEDFEFESEGMEGKYQLIAAIYSGKEISAVAQLKYPKSISTANYRELIQFDLTNGDFQRNVAAEYGRVAGTPLVLTLTVFEGAPGNYRKSAPVANATATVIGHSEFGKFQSDAEGSLRIQGITSRSEFIIEVSAPGFYPTRKTVPVFDSNAYSAVYLLAKDKVESVTKYFTKHDQKEEKALVMGRVYDPKTRAPLKDEQLFLSFRRGPATYFDALPNLSLKATTSTGLFGFYNIEPSFRTLQRSSGKHSELVSTLPGYGYYVELGRGGAKQVLGKLLDPFLNQGVAAKVSLLGDENNAIAAAEDGTFAIPAVDLPPGVLTLEISAENYPPVWQTIPWNTREAERSRTLFMLEKEMLTESRKVNRVALENGRGTIVGGAEASFFDKGRKCVGVQLLDSNGVQTSREFGPFPIAGARNAAKGFCLSQKAPGFAFFNVPSGEYLIKWLDEKHNTFRTHVIRVGVNRTSVLVN